MFTGRKGRTRFSAPIPDAIFFVISFICVVHDKFSSTYTPRDLAWETCLIGVPLIVKFGADWNVQFVESGSNGGVSSPLRCEDSTL